jgi:predicted glutamine amidotransferase
MADENEYFLLPTLFVRARSLPSLMFEIQLCDRTGAPYHCEHLADRSQAYALAARLAKAEMRQGETVQSLFGIGFAVSSKGYTRLIVKVIKV